MDYAELSERLQKTLYYGFLSKTESSSLSLTSKKKTITFVQLPLTIFLSQMSLLKNSAKMMIYFWRDSVLILQLISQEKPAFPHARWFWP